MSHLHKNLKFWLLSLVLVTAVSSCTDDFDQINTNPNTVLRDRIDENLLFTRSLVYGALRYTEFQRAQQLYANHYIQYYAMSVDYFETGRYITRNDWLTDYWTAVYSDYAMQCQQVIDITRESENKSNKTAMARIWKVFLMHRVTDFWGDVPYFNALQGDLTPEYDRQEDIYDDMLNELKEAVAQFDPSKTLSYSSADVIYQSDIDSWIRFANSLRLRLAMRISDVDPAKAEQHAREVIEDGRLIDSNNASAIMPYGRDFGGAVENLQPMGVIRSFNEYRASNTLVDFLQSNNDPRLPLYIEPVEGEYIGLQNGLNPEEINALNLDQFSKDSQIISSTHAPSVLFSYSEVQFLLAEASLKGWHDGDAQLHYEEGIVASINFWIGVYNDLLNRLPDSEASALPNIDITAEDIANYTAEPGIVFDPNNALEQIITQKWLANINQGFESYAEYRRTGFPVLNPIPNTDGLSETGGSEVPVRIKYPAEEQTLNRENYQAAVAGQGPDLPTTRMWWDVQ